MKLRPYFALPCLVLAATLATGGAAATARAAGVPTPAVPAVPAKPAGQPENLADLPDSQLPNEHVSTSGQFSATFPTGCGRLYTKMNTAPDGSDDVEVRICFVNCERAGTKNEGCQVISRLGAARGLTREASRDLVLGEIRKLLTGFEVVPAQQNPVRRDFGPHGVAEGLDIQAHPQSGAGDVWIRGLLRGEDIFLVLAWKAAGGLFDDPEYGVFFQSFRPWADVESEAKK